MLFLDAEGDATGTDFQQTELPRRSVMKRKFDERQVTTDEADARGHAPAGVFDRGISLQAFTSVVDEGRTYGPAAILSSPSMRHGIFAGLLLLASGTSFAAEPAQRALTFEDRVKAQEAIQRIYYSHQIGATKPFEQAVPRRTLEDEVRKYLGQSAAERGSRMPGRLRELFTSLGNDAFLVLECVARPALVDRLSRNFFASGFPSEPK